MSEADPPKPVVGYRSPPVEYQFKKGVSGNPKGRPKSKRARPQASLEFAAQPANAMLIEEAYRMVSVREGDQVIQLPAIKAMFRAMGMSAIKGNRHAQRMLADLVREVEEADRKTRQDHFEVLVEHKCEWESKITAAKARGQEPPSPIPHPDDIIIDLHNGRAVVCGPSTNEEKERWDEVLKQLDGLQDQISRHATAYRKARSGQKKVDALHRWKVVQKLFNQWNDNLPKRYRRSLKDRCWELDASQPGSERTRTWPGE